MSGQFKEWIRLICLQAVLPLPIDRQIIQFARQNSLVHSKSYQTSIIDWRDRGDEPHTLGILSSVVLGGRPIKRLIESSSDRLADSAGPAVEQ